MITIFTTPKSFDDRKIAVSQKNAILSWKKMCPGAEIILFGNDFGVKEISEKLKLRHIPEVRKNEYGKPFLNSLFELAKQHAQNNILAYISCDIILLSDLEKIIKNIDFPLYLLGGRRWDLKIEEQINFEKSGWQNELIDKARKQGKFHGHCATDYLVFSKQLEHNMPPFVIGVAGWDNWLIYKARFLKVPVIDATLAINIIHQDHDYSHSSFGRSRKNLGGRIEGPQLQKNMILAGNDLNIMTLLDANWILDKSRKLKKPSSFRLILSKISFFYPWRQVRKLRRQLRHIFSI